MRASTFFALALVGCAQPISGAPRWDANVDAPWPEGGSRYVPPRSSAHGGGGGRPASECFAQLLVIFDRSGSMATLWESPDVSGPRWRLAADALTAAVEPLADRLEIGAILFPTIEPRDFETCAPVDPIESQLDYRDGRSFLSAWADTWASPDLRGSTPIDTAFDAGDAALDDVPEVTAVVLLTDGEPTCTGPISAFDRAAAWNVRGIDTFVIGLPGTGGTDYLDALAAAGGTGSALSVEDPAALTSGLTAILGEQVDQACR